MLWDMGLPGNGSLTGNLRIRGANQPMLASKAESGNAVEVKYVPAQVVEDVVFESETIPVGEALQPIEGLRTNFAETAFFYPQLRTNEQGELAFSFTMPQSLTPLEFPWLLTY